MGQNALAGIVPARPCPVFGRPIHQRGGPLDYGSVVLRKPFRFHFTMDTLPSVVSRQLANRHDDAERRLAVLKRVCGLRAAPGGRPPFLNNVKRCGDRRGRDRRPRGSDERCRSRYRAAFARSLASEAAKVAVADIDPGNTVVDRIRAEGGEALAIRTDFLAEAACGAMVDAP